jgi:hypothetical protein
MGVLLDLLGVSELVSRRVDGFSCGGEGSPNRMVSEAVVVNRHVWAKGKQAIGC